MKDAAQDEGNKPVASIHDVSPALKEQDLREGEENHEVLKGHPRREPPRVFFQLSKGTDEAALQAVFTFIDHLLADDVLRDNVFK